MLRDLKFENLFLSVALFCFYDAFYQFGKVLTKGHSCKRSLKLLEAHIFQDDFSSLVDKQNCCKDFKIRHLCLLQENADKDDDLSNKDQLTLEIL